jgi:CheY-like chemotaxis protein
VTGAGPNEEHPGPSPGTGSPRFEGVGHLLAGRFERDDSVRRRVAQQATVELRILLIEDSELLRGRLSQMLTEPGRMRVVASAATEAEARQKIEAEEYDVLLVDVELQEGSGIGAIRHARATYAPARQPLIIVLTNYPLPAVRSRCIDAGADYFLDKMRQFQEVKPLISAARPLPRS